MQKSENNNPMAMLPTRDPRLLSGGIGPVSALVFRSNHTKLLQSPSSGGIRPVNELLLSFKIARLDNFPIQDGISPLSLLFESEIQFKLEQLLNPEGMFPDKKLKSRIKFCNISPLGIEPDKLLALRSNNSRPTIFEKDSGRDPVNSLKDRTSFLRLLISAKTEIINSPVNLLCEISSNWSEEQRRAEVTGKANRNLTEEMKYQETVEKCIHRKTGFERRNCYRKGLNTVSYCNRRNRFVRLTYYLGGEVGLTHRTHGLGSKEESQDQKSCCERGQ
ncbi:hypothetical protein Lal_00001751 [Lupinus albus]|nr:hypothetical protein Lal_00001751 [Lupinus albus]